MPGPSRWMIRISFVYLLMGILTGMLMLVHKAYPLHPSIWILLSVHIEMVIFGWIIQLTMGTGYWILPRFLKGPPRGREYMAWIMVGVFNAGILLIVMSHLNVITDLAIVIGRVLEITGVILFIGLHWRRIVSYRENAA